MHKEVIIKFDKQAFEEYKKLQTLSVSKKPSKSKTSYIQLLNSLNNTLTNIKFNPYYGNLIPRKYLTKKIINKYGTDKIFRCKLIGFWRLLYTIIGDEVKIIALILEFVNHKDYNELLGYKNN
jgi:aromatic ring-opening dioxygenase LigB subunit